VEVVSFQSPLVGPCIHIHKELYKGLAFKPEPAPGRNHKPQLKPDFGLKAKFTQGVKICATAEKQKNVVCRCSCRYTVYQTENSNHLDQNIGIIWHKRSMLVNDNTAKYNISQEKKKLSTMAL